MKKLKNKLSELSQTHGKVENKEYVTLDQIWGDNGLSKYKTLDENEYTNYLNELNKTDLQAHASQVGLIPVDNRESLTKRLVKEFRKHVALYKAPQSNKSKVKLNKQASDILSEGK